MNTAELADRFKVATRPASSFWDMAITPRPGA